MSAPGADVCQAQAPCEMVAGQHTADSVAQVVAELRAPVSNHSRELDAGRESYPPGQRGQA
ncbi:MAG TPA: hypothetical protein VF256_18150 [Streptosporangiaceae bacterium]